MLFRRPPELFAPGAVERMGAVSGYTAAAPYPHVVMDDLFNPAALKAILREWPYPKHVPDKELSDTPFYFRKTGTDWKTKYGPATRSYFALLASPEFLKVLERVTGIAGIIPDPYMLGGGLHMTRAGGKLAMHRDFTFHPNLRLDRRLNLLIYLNEGWTEENAGHLELWDREMKACARSVLPVFNRLVLFNTDDTSFHGQPNPIVGPPDLWRKSVAIYYYSAGRPEEEKLIIKTDDTEWRERPIVGL